MHFLINFGTLVGFILSAGAFGFLGGVYVGVSVSRPLARKFGTQASTP